MIVTVEAKSKFGILGKEDKKWHNTGDSKEGQILLNSFVVGNAYEVEECKVKDSKGKVRNVITKATFVNSNKEAFKAKEPVGDVVTPPKNFVPKKEYKERDFDKEARGKTMCALIEAGLQSPRVQMLEKNEQLFAFLDAVVDYGIKKIFKD